MARSGIVADGALSSAQVVIDALLKVLCEMTGAVMDLLNTKVHIPVISDILNELGVADFSLMELFCWIAVVVTTLAYKVAHGGSAPFPDDTLPNAIKSAPDWNSLGEVVKLSPPSNTASASGALVQKLAMSAVSRDAPAPAPTDAAPTTGNPAFPTFDSHLASIIGHSFAGVYQASRTFSQLLEASVTNPPMWMTVISLTPKICAAVASLIGNHLCFQDPEDDGVKYASWATTGITMAASAVLPSPVVRWQVPNPELGSMWTDPRAVSAVVNSVLVIPAVVCTALHLVELENHPSGYDATPARVDEACNIFSYINRWAYAMAVLPNTPAVKQESLVTMSVANVAMIALQFTEGMDPDL